MLVESVGRGCLESSEELDILMGKSENFSFDFEVINDKPLGRSFEICLENCKEEEEEENSYEDEEQSICGPSFASLTSSGSDHVFPANSRLVVDKETTMHEASEARRKGLILAATNTAATLDAFELNDSETDSETIASRGGLKQETEEEAAEEEEEEGNFSDELRGGSSTHQSHVHNLASESAMNTTTIVRLAQWIAFSPKDNNGQQKPVIDNRGASTDESPVVDRNFAEQTFEETSRDHYRRPTSSGCCFSPSPECGKELFASLASDKATEGLRPAAIADKFSYAKPHQDAARGFLITSTLRDPDRVPRSQSASQKKDFAQEMDKLEQEWSLQKKNAAKRQVKRARGGGGGGGGDCNEWFRQRLWCYLFDNLYRAIDELYFLCELQCDFGQMKEAMLVLKDASLDFEDLRSRTREVHEEGGDFFDGVGKKTAPGLLDQLLDQYVSLATSARSSADHHQEQNPQKHQASPIIWQLERRKKGSCAGASSTASGLMQDLSASSTAPARKGTSVSTNQSWRPKSVVIVAAAAEERSFAGSSRDDGEKETPTINALKRSPPPPPVQAATASAWQRAWKKKDEPDVNSVASLTRSSCSGKPGSKKIFLPTAGTERLMRPTQSSGYRIATTSRQKRQIATKDQACKEKRSWVDIFSARKPRILPPEKTTTTTRLAGKCQDPLLSTSDKRRLLCSRCVREAVEPEFTWEKEVIAAAAAAAAGEESTQAVTGDDRLLRTHTLIPETRTLASERQELVGNKSVILARELRQIKKLSYEAAAPHDDRRWVCDNTTCTADEEEEIPGSRSGENFGMDTDKFIQVSCKSSSHLNLQTTRMKDPEEISTKNYVSSRKLATTKSSIVDVTQEEEEQVCIEEEPEDSDHDHAPSSDDDDDDDHYHVKQEIAEQQENTLSAPTTTTTSSCCSPSPSTTAREALSLLSGSRFGAPRPPSSSAQPSTREARRHGRTAATAASAQ